MDMQNLSDAKGYDVCQLEFGDYESEPDGNGKVIRVERKSADFLGSMMDGNIFQQLKRMNNDETTAKSFLVVDRNFTDVMKEAILRDMHPNVVYGYIASLSQYLYHPPIFLDNKMHTIEFIDSVFKKHIDEKDHSVHEKTRIGGDNLLVFPGVDTVIGKKLMTHFGSFRAIACAEVEDLKLVHGVGEKTAKRVYDLCHFEYGKFM